MWYFGLLWVKTKQILVWCPYDKEVHGTAKPSYDMQDNLNPASDTTSLFNNSVFRPYLKTPLIRVGRSSPYDKEVNGLQGMEQQSHRMTCETTSTPPLTQLPFSIKKNPSFGLLWYFGLLWFKTKQSWSYVHMIKKSMEQQSRRMTCETTSALPNTTFLFN